MAKTEEMVKDWDFYAAFEGFDVQFHEEVGNFLFCPTGESYLTVVSGGIKPEGSPAYLFDSAKDAYQNWKDVVQAVLKDVERKVVGENEGKLTIFWRRVPEMRSFRIKRGKPEGWTVYSRFRASRRPIIQSADYNKVEGRNG